MKIVIAFLMAVLASVSGFSQEERPVNPVRILTAGQHIIPYKIEVTFGKTVHILFPSEVRYVDSSRILCRIAGFRSGNENTFLPVYIVSRQLNRNDIPGILDAADQDIQTLSLYDRRTCYQTVLRNGNVAGL